MRLSFRFGRLKRSKPERKRRRQLDDALSAEAQATLHGIKAFEAHQQTFTHSSPLLRRNIHRLEKGLCMPVRRSVFGTAFIVETVELFARLAQQEHADTAELQWAHDVLHRYFSAVDITDQTIQKARSIWADIDSTQIQAASFTPYRVADLSSYVGDDAQSLPDFDAFLKLCRARRSQRWFRDAPVPLEKLEAAVEAALQAPSACNRQPFRFYCARTPSQIARISALPLGTKGFGDDLPCLIAVVGDLSMYAHSRDRHLIFIDAALSSMQLMLALTAQGLGSVPINWPDLPENHESLRSILGLSAHQVPIMLIGIGIPTDDCMIPYSAKRPVSEALRVID